jgi:hypothetical protein
MSVATGRRPDGSFRHFPSLTTLQGVACVFPKPHVTPSESAEELELSHHRVCDPWLQTFDPSGIKAKLETYA